MQKITPCLWFDNNAEEAVNFYTSIFKASKIGTVARYSEEGPGEPGSVMVIEFELDGMEYMALNGWPMFKLTEAVSLMVHCKDQKEIDYFWERLGEGGSEQQCGWLKDKFGLSWQVIPNVLMEMMGTATPEQSRRMTHEIMNSVKFDIAKLQKAYDG